MSRRHEHHHYHHASGGDSPGCTIVLLLALCCVFPCLWPWILGLLVLGLVVWLLDQAFT